MVRQGDTLTHSSGVELVSVSVLSVGLLEDAVLLLGIGPACLDVLIELLVHVLLEITLLLEVRGDMGSWVVLVVTLWHWLVGIPTHVWVSIDSLVLRVAKMPLHLVAWVIVRQRACITILFTIVHGR